MEQAQLEDKLCIDVANLIVQAIIGVATLAGVMVSLYQVHREKILRMEEERRKQSTRISLWYEEHRDRTDWPRDDRFVWREVVLRNASESPVYDVIVTCVGISGAGPEPRGEDNGRDFPYRTCVGTLPPGTWYVWLPTGGAGMHVRTAPEGAFTDAGGISWVRRGNGKLEEIGSEPASFYELDLPLEWGGCKRLDR